MHIEPEFNKFPAAFLKRFCLAPLFKERRDFFPGTRCFYEFKPAARWFFIFLGENFDNRSVKQFVVEWLDSIVYLCADGGIADIGVYGVCKINCRCAFRQIKDIALWG